MAAARGPRDLHVVLLAGGSGTRFWPLSRRARPKQFLPLTGGAPLVAETWKRVRRLVPPSRLWVVAPRRLKRDVLRALPELRPDRLVLEPSPRDTSPAVGLACAAVERAAPGATVAIFPTDHAIADADAFADAVLRAVAAAASGALVCLGIRPDRPATGYGYLECAAKPGGRGAGAVPVRRFVEKPDAARARRFLAAGRFLWNAGMFVWRAEAFLAELARAAPEIHDAVRATAAGRRGAWEGATKLSVDYAVMEKARRVEVVPLVAGWDDVGSWDAAARLRAASGSGDGALRVGSPDSAVFGAGGKLVAIVELPGVVVVETDDALLVVAGDRTERVREVVRRLQETGRDDLL